MVFKSSKPLQSWFLADCGVTGMLLVWPPSCQVCLSYSRVTSNPWKLLINCPHTVAFPGCFTDRLLALRVVPHALPPCLSFTAWWLIASESYSPRLCVPPFMCPSTLQDVLVAFSSWQVWINLPSTLMYRLLNIVTLYSGYNVSGWVYFRNPKMVSFHPHIPQATHPCCQRARRKSLVSQCAEGAGGLVNLFFFFCINFSFENFYIFA